MTDPYALGLDSARTQFYREFSASLALPRRVTKPKAELHDRMAAHWLERAISLGRPPYREALGFTRDRWQLNPRPSTTPGTSAGGGVYDTWRSSICGRERPYGYGSRAFWRTVWLTMRSAFLAEWCRATGATYETTEGGRNMHAIVTGIT